MTESDPRRRFSATVDLYKKYRPDYPASVFDWIEVASGAHPPATVVDLGCGTGISTRRLAAKGYATIGIDPNEAMLEKARAEEGAEAIQYRFGECTRTGLDAASVDLVVAAQAFHWFPIEATIAECKRILRPNGAIVALWNVRAPVPLLDDYDALIRRYSSDYADIPGFRETSAAIAASPSVRDVQRTTLENVQMFDRDGLHGRAWSSSYVVHGVADKAGFDAGLDAIFDAHQRDGVVAFAYLVEAILVRPR